MKKLLFFALLPLVWMSCTKEPKEKTRSELLRESTWRVSSYKAKYYDSTDSKDSVLDLYESKLPSCMRDNRLQFGVNHEGYQLLQGDACNTGELEKVRFDWELTDNETVMKLYNIGYVFIEPNLRGDIIRWDDTSINLRYFVYPKMPDFIGDTVTYSVQLKNK